MFFSASPWLFLLFAVPGLWLTYRLYFGSGISLGIRWRHVLAALTAAAWLALAWFAVQPFWKLNPEIYHPPAVVLAIDESQSYAALGARAAADSGIVAVQRHYESLGFRVHTVGFTRVSALSRTLDSIPPPNLQAILLWSDGRFGKEGEQGQILEDWPAPVFPVFARAVDEPQGEKVTVDVSRPENGAEITVAWRGAENALLEIRAAGKTVWTQRLVRPRGTEAGVAVTQVFQMPAGIAQKAAEGRARRVGWTALVKSVAGKLPGKPAVPNIVENDTVPIQFTGVGRFREFFIRPLVSLEERGLVDALSSDSSEVTAVFPGEVKSSGLSAGDVLWVHGARSIVAGTATTVHYHLPEESEGLLFDADARVSWRDEGAAFMPAEVLRLGDLGVESQQLRAPDSSVETLAWAEQNGKRGLLLWRARKSGVYGFVPPAMWRTGFRAAGSGQNARAGQVREVQVRWVRGVAAWVRGLKANENGGKSAVSSDYDARDPLDVEMSRLGTQEETLVRMASASGGAMLNGTSWPTLRGGQERETRFRAVSLAPVWPAVLWIVFLLCVVWGLRKRLQID